MLFRSGAGDSVLVKYRNRYGRTREYSTSYEGVVPWIKRRHESAESDFSREQFESYMREVPCKACKGARLKPSSLAVKVNGMSLSEVCDLSIGKSSKFLAGLTLSDRDKMIAERVVKEINARLGFLLDVGLEYLTLSRAAATLAGGEAQRIRLASQIGSGLVGTLYVLDEPSIGLHQRDNHRLIETLERLRDLGNTVLVVEHDEDTIRASDWLVDIGPGAGEHGGEIVYSGPVDGVLRVTKSVTGQYLSGKRFVAVPGQRRPTGDDWLTIRGAREHNLKNLTVKVPLGCFVAVTGVSGSGKSTLARCLMRLIEPSSGHIHWGSHEVANLHERALRPLRDAVQVVFQDPNRSLNPRRTVGQSLMEGAKNFGLGQAQALERAQRWIEQVQLPISALDRYPHQFSGGQRQRIALARALACEPRVLVADAAVSALDVSVQAQILALLRRIQSDIGLGLLFITHDLRVAAQLCDRVIVMHQGQIVETGATAAVYADPQHPYKRRLFESAPSSLEHL